MAIAPVQSNESHPNGAATSIGLAFGSNVTAASLIIAAASWDYSGTLTINSVTDGLSNTYTQIGTTLQDTTNTQALAVFRAYNVSGGACTPTFNFAASVDFRRIAIAEYSGARTASDPYDTSQTVAGGTTATGTDGTATASITPSEANALIFAVLSITSASDAVAAGTSFTERQDGLGAISAAIQIEDFTQGAAAAIPGRWTVTTAGNKFNALVASFLEPGGAPPAEAPKLRVVQSNQRW